jgi:hypothetical protein
MGELDIARLVAVNELHKPTTWRRELIAAGWIEERHTVWRDPNGRLWRGPFGAWREMKRREKGKSDD